jgi:hypothetical protein
MTASASYNLSGKAFDIKNLGRFQLDSIISLVSGFALFISPDLLPKEKGCPQPDWKWNFQLCLEACAGAASFEACVQYPNPPHFFQKFKAGWCGFPSASLKLKFDSKVCK